MENGGRCQNCRIGVVVENGKMGKMKERERETREDFGDLWCLGLVHHENGKV